MAAAPVPPTAAPVRERVLAPVAAPGDAKPERGWWGRLLFAAGLTGAEGTGGVGLSLAVHGVLLLVGALWAVEVNGGVPGLTLSATVGTEEDAPAFELTDTATVLSGSSEPFLQAPPLEADLTDDGTLALLAAQEAAFVAGEGAGDGEGDGEGVEVGDVALTSPGGGQIVRAGSFTAWTIPADPRPQQNYVIVIQVDLPAALRLQRYPKKDMWGEVRGTDGYLQRIPSDDPRGRRGFFPVKNNKAQVLIPVLGAERLVKDRIKVGSRLLNESQTLELTF